MLHSGTIASASSLTRRLWFLIGLSLLLIVLSVQYTSKIFDSDRDNRSAFLRWRDQILDVQNGVNLYERYNYPNPPIMFLILEPLAFLPPAVGALAWFYLKIAMAAFVILWAFRLVEERDRPFPTWGKVLAVLLSLRPIMGDLSHGNVNIFIAFLVLGALFAYQRRQDFGAGLLLGLAIACKVTPALFLPYFLWKRSWTVLAGSLVGLVLFFGVVPSVFLGATRNHEFLTSWFDRMVRPYVLDGEVTSEHNNQSLPGLVHRLLTPNPSFTAMVDDQYVPTEYHNVLSLENALAGWIIKAAELLFVVVVLWSCRTPTELPRYARASREAGQGVREPRQNWRLAGEFALVLLGMLLFSERTWKHHCVTLVLPFALVCYYLSALQPPRWLRNSLFVMLGLVVLLMLSTSTGLFDRLDRGAKLAQTYGAYVWAYVILIVALVVLLRRKETPSDQASTSGTTCPSTSGNGLPVRSVSSVSGSIPSR